LFFKLPEDKREIALTVMEKMGKCGFPTGLQQLKIQRWGDSAQQAMENTYREAADIFAISIDPKFKDYEKRGCDDSSSEETENLRAIFLNMIRGCSAEQVLTGVEEIKRLTLAEASPQTVDPQLVRTVRKGLLRLMADEDEAFKHLEDPTSHAEGYRIIQRSFQRQVKLFEQAGMDYKVFYRAMLKQGEIERQKLGNNVFLTESQTITSFFRANKQLPGFSWKL
jgi:hypothetical protein